MVHIKCRGGLYPFSNVKRLVFPDYLVPWTEKFESYDPPEYESKVLINKAWADPYRDDDNFKPKWYNVDGTINRKSHMGTYAIVGNRPLNPEGRTGLKGRGILGKWGPNHAADPIVTRWKMFEGKKQYSSLTKLPILQFCAIQRKDCGQWALPGGMVDPGETVNETLKREFMEEALNSLESSEEQVQEDTKIISSFFSSGWEVYKGYVDDPRNTDNAWMETVAINFHDEDGTNVGKFNLKAGDDAQSVCWMDIDQKLDLYASHLELIRIVQKKRGAHW